MYFVSLNDHSDYYNFYDPYEIIVNFSNLSVTKVTPDKNLETANVKATFLIVNYQQPKQNCLGEITDNMIWSTMFIVVLILIIL